MASIGGGYAALMGKKKSSGGNKEPKQKVKAAKVLSLKDTKEKKPGAGKQAPVAKQEEAKPQVKKVEEKEVALTKKQVKAEEKSTDRHVPRSGHAPESKGQKSGTVEEAVQAMNEKPAKELDERQKRWKEEDEAREREARENEKRVTYADYQKQAEAKRAEMGIKKPAERKVDNNQFKKMVEVAGKDDENAFMTFSKKEVAKPVKAPAKTQQKKGKAAEVVEAPKKKKFSKVSDVELGFRGPQNDRPRRGDRPPRRDQEPAPAPVPEEEPKTEAEPEAEEAAAPAEEQTE